jgi:hypothetical protein
MRRVPSDTRSCIHAAGPDLADHAVAPDVRPAGGRRARRLRSTERVGHELAARRAAVEVELRRLELDARQDPGDEGRDDVLRQATFHR